MEEKSIKYSPLEKFLHFVEVLGNKIPNPILMFIWLAAAIVLLSGICSFFGVSEINPVMKCTLFTGHPVRRVHFALYD